MADVFLSYAREDSGRAQQIAEGLQAEGLAVFWDTEIPPGTTWADYIEEKLAQCKALIVLWSERSTKSQWVREEARMGRDKGVLIPVMIDASQPPFGFGEVQAANLANWTGDRQDVNWRRFADAVTRLSNAAPRPAPAPQADPAPQAQSAPQPLHHAPQPQPAAAPSAWSTQAPPAQGERNAVPQWMLIAGAAVATLIVIAGITMFMNRDGGQTPQGVQTAAGGGGQNYQQQINDRLAAVAPTFTSRGYQQLTQPVSGSLEQGAVANVPINLEAGGEYSIVGVCDGDCGDLDLVLYDQNSVLISQDNAADATPIVSVAPQWSGPFTVQVVMHNCTVSPCFYALALYGRRAGQ